MSIIEPASSQALSASVSTRDKTVVSVSLLPYLIHILHPVDTVAITKVVVYLLVKVASIGGLIRISCRSSIHYKEGWKHKSIPVWLRVT